MNKVIALFTLAVLLAACQETKNQLSPISIETSQQTYTAGSTVAFTIKNDDSKPLYISTCDNDQVAVQVRSTLSISSEISSCASMSYISIAPGSSLSGSFQFNIAPGEYVIEIMSGSQPDKLLGKVLSNHFTIE